MRLPWRQWVFGPHATRTALLAAVGLALPFCATGFFMDDGYHQTLLDGSTLWPGDRWHLFTFATGNPDDAPRFIQGGFAAWWSNPELFFSFFRPLTAVVANAERAVVGSFAPLMHLHSIAWYAVLVAVVGRLFERALGVGAAVASLSVVLFAIDDSHALASGWIANRNALLSSVPAVLAVLAHLRWRTEGWSPGLPLSVLGAVVGLLAGESALGALAYLVAWEVTVGPGAWRTRLAALAPMALVGVGFVAVYRWSGSGAFGSGLYVDPLRETGSFLAQAPGKALALIAAQFLGATADVWMALPPVRPALIGSGVVTLVMLSAMVKRLWPELPEPERASVKWLSLGAAGSLVPVLATFPLNRLLLLPSIGGAALTAVLVMRAWRHEARWLRVLARGLLVCTLVPSALGWPLTAAALGLGSRVQVRGPMETSLSDEALSGHVFAFSAPDPSAAMYAAMTRTRLGRPAARSWNTVTFANVRLRLSRLDERTVDVQVLDGVLLDSTFEQLFRPPDVPVQRGMKVRLAKAELEVTQATDGRVRGLLLRFDEALESGAVTFVKWTGDGLEPLVVPVVGQALELPAPNGLFSL
jgi:hypothetical protein